MISACNRWGESNSVEATSAGIAVPQCGTWPINGVRPSPMTSNCRSSTVKLPSTMEENEKVTPLQERILALMLEGLSDEDVWGELGIGQDLLNTHKQAL